MSKGFVIYMASIGKAAISVGVSKGGFEPKFANMRRILLFTVIPIVFCLTACGSAANVNESVASEYASGENGTVEDVKIVLNESSFVTIPEILNVTVTNHSTEEVRMGFQYSIEFFDEPNWETVLSNPVVPAALVILQPNDSFEFIFHTFPQEIDYRCGKYRLVKAAFENPVMLFGEDFFHRPRRQVPLIHVGISGFCQRSLRSLLRSPRSLARLSPFTK